MLRHLTGPVFRVPGSRSRNSPGWITLGMGETYPAAVLAQERFEQVGYRLAMLLIGLPAGLAFGWMTGLWIVAPALVVLSAALCQIGPIWRWRELRGTAIDIALAAREFGADLGAYEDAKVASRVGYPQFEGWDKTRMKAAFVALRPWAERNASAWLDRPS